MRIAVTGASGQLGRAVAEGLLEVADAGDVVLITRSPDRLADLARRGADVRYGDFDSPVSLEAAFAGIDRLLLISGDAIGSRLPGHLAAVAAASAAGVRHLVYTSIGNPSDDNPAVVAHEHRATEDAIRASGLAWTFLRNGIYMETLLGLVEGALATGTLPTNAGEGKSGYVAREDCAAAAVAVLTTAGHEGRVLDVTGPEAFDPEGLAALIGEVGGTPVTVVHLDDAAWAGAMTEHAGLPAELARALATFGAAQRHGYSGVVTPTVERLTGRPPVALREVLLRSRTPVAAG